MTCPQSLITAAVAGSIFLAAAPASTSAQVGKSVTELDALLGQTLSQQQRIAVYARLERYVTIH
jgi:hypothetical protein